MILQDRFTYYTNN